MCAILSRQSPADRVYLIQPGAGESACPKNLVIELEDSRCGVAAVLSDDLRCKSLIQGVSIGLEDPRCKSLGYGSVTEMDDPRCKRAAIEMDDPRCQNLGNW